MAVRFDAAGENYSASGGLPGSTYTFTAWVLLAATSLTDNNVVYWFTNGSDVFTGIEVRSTLNDLQGYDSATYSFNGLGPLAVSANTWYRCALVVNGANATFYRAAAGSALGSASASDFTTPTTPNEFFLGDDRYDEYWNGRLAAVKVWTAALTQAEVEHELAQYVPARTANLIRFHPFVKAETTDYSGSGNTLSGGSGTSTEDGPPIPWRIISPTVIVPAAGALSAVLGQPSETDTAQAVARIKLRSVGQATGTDTARPVTAVRSRGLGLTAETDAAQAVARAKARLLGQATGSDVAQTVTRLKTRVVGQTVESDTAQPVVAGGAVLIGQPAEADLAQGAARAKAAVVAQAAETATARTTGRVKTAAVGQCADVETARAVVAAKMTVLGLLGESDSALTVTRLRVLAIGQGAETDTARAVARVKTWSSWRATETDAALAVVAVGGGVAPPPPDPVPAAPASAGWYTLLAISQEARDLAQDEAARRPTACPNCGEPLQAGPGGVLHCRFDGYRA